MLGISFARYPERLAWVVIWLSFLAFCLLVMATFFGIRWYIQATAEPRLATIELIRGPALVQEAGRRRDSSVLDGMELREGDRIRTPAEAQVLISLFDGSNVRLWPSTELRIDRSRSSRFNQALTQVRLRQESGHTRIEVAPPVTDEREFEVSLPTAGTVVLLREGSYRIQVDGEVAEVAVRSGSASVVTGQRAVEVLRHERVVLAPDVATIQPRSAERNLIGNGDFRDGLAGWQAGNRDVEDATAGTITVVEQDERKIARLARGESLKHAETYLHYPLNHDVTDYQDLHLALDLKIAEQSLAGGGWVGSEYPVLVRLRYRDSLGSEALWQRGFYIQNRDGHPTTYGHQVDPQTWNTLRVDLFDSDTVTPRPATLLWLEIVASGWRYESYVANIKLLAE
ncbi:MAG: FecR domain-containing protein [Chloroflexi bacterium]|nr:FecR domain-containing protein [Chloroflexota bacterium]